MKKFKSNLLMKFLLFSLPILLLYSCTKDEGITPLTVTSISKARVDDPLKPNDGIKDGIVDVMTDTIVVGRTYIIKGSGFSTLKSISFNGRENNFNPNFVTDNAIVIHVDDKVPYENLMNNMTIVTKHETLSYNVRVYPPFPSITGYSVNPDPNDILTIDGDYFKEPKVFIGTTPIDIISSDLKQIKIKMPSNLSDFKYKDLIIKNLSGTTVCKQSFGTAIYDDKFSNIYSFSYLWDATNPFKLDYNKDVYFGSKCIFWQPKGWQGFVFDIDPSKIKFSDFRGLRIAIKGDSNGSAQFFLNGDFSKNLKLDFKSSWTYLEIPFNYFGVTEFKELIIQEAGNKGGNTLYIDDIGLLVKN